MIVIYITKKNRIYYKRFYYYKYKISILLFYLYKINLIHNQIKLLNINSLYIKKIFFFTFKHLEVNV